MRSIKINDIESIKILYEKKMEELSSIINNLQIDDVKDDPKFYSLVEKLKADFRIEPVEINRTPKMINHKEVQRTTPTNDPFYRGTTINFLEVTVHYDYSGSKELFKYRDSSPISHYSNSPSVIIQPEGDFIPVIVELHSLNKEEAIQKANNIMALTFQIASNNSKAVKGWNDNLDSLIDIHITKKREELIKFYS